MIDVVVVCGSELEPSLVGRALRTDPWRVRIGHSAAQTMVQLEESPADVVVADRELADLDGALLLQSLRDVCPRAVRVLVDKEGWARGSHLTASPPRTSAELATIVGRAAARRGLLDGDAVRALLAPLGALPVAPKAWLELEALTSDPETSVRRVAAAVGRDAGLAASVLKLTNSPVNGLRRTVTSVEDATALLGVTTVRRLVLGAEVARTFAGADLPGTTLEELSLRGEACGQLASRLLGPGRSQEERHLALTAGMLRDVGQLALAHLLPSELAEVREQAISRSLPMGAIEVLRWGVTHAEIGAHLLRAWGLPDTVADAVAGHHALLPSAGDAPTPAQAVALASLLMAERGGPLADPAERDEGTTLEEAAEEAGVLNALDDWRLLASVTLSAAEGAAA